MKYLIGKEIDLFFRSVTGYLIIAVWLLATSLMLWVFKGSYNLPGSGYASLYPFFSLVPVLFLFLVPAVCMRLVAEEKRTGTFELLRFRPWRLSSLLLGKYISACLLMIFALLPTLLYVVSLNLMSTAGLDAGEVIGGYIGVLCLIFVFAAIGLFSSSVSSNQLGAFLIALALSFMGFYGFDLLASLVSAGGMHNFVSDLGMNAHYRSLMRGVIGSGDILYFLLLSLVFFLLSVGAVAIRRDRRFYIKTFTWVLALAAAGLVSFFIHIRWDLTESRRYTLSEQTKQLINGLDKPLEVILYLNGDLNPAFDRLRRATLDLLEELSQKAPAGIYLKQVNPSAASDQAKRQENYLRMDQRGMQGISVNERDNEGKLSSKVLFPWMEVVYGGDTLPVGLLRRNISLSAQEVLNLSIGELEYGLADAVRLLTLKEPSSVAFIEGHGEWPEAYVYEATSLLSKYYQVDRGRISGRPEELFPYKVLIIAAPQTPFTESEKFALDQYLMQGGSLLFFIDGTRISPAEFEATGESPTLKNELNLDDLLFTYGVRVNPVTVQDMNCTAIRLATSEPGVKGGHTTLPWYFAPLLEPAPSHLITRSLSPLKSEQVSTLSLVGDADLEKTVLLTTSASAHTLPVPEKVSLRYVEMPAEAAYFNESYLPVAALVEGRFPSAFRNRLLPEGGAVEPQGGRLLQSEPARVLVAATGSLPKNDWKGQGSQAEPLPLGFDAVSGEELGNAGFLVNAVNYLAGNEKWLSLRAKDLRLRLLDKQEVTSGLLKWQILNVGLPLLLLFLVGGGVYLRCKRRYNR